MNVTTRKEKTNFGVVIYVEDVNKSFSFAMYRYDDDPSTVYLANVFVEESQRGKGFGNIILNSADEIAKRVNASSICLRAEIGSFAHQWYKRHGYTDFEKENKFMWMEKKIYRRDLKSLLFLFC